ncbi:hypothetical protein LBMAG56_47960 [Verrucomicrobiota bacterium]|nr:hypothetical protein LBMAG56_47960 [Verrucomicrobiota bacterium]
MYLPHIKLRIVGPATFLLALAAGALLLVGCGNSSAFKATLAKATSGDPQAQVDLGLMYLSGNGVKENEVEALNWHKQAAMKGLPAGQREYGRRLRDGIGGGRNLAAAREWLEKAANANDVEAQIDLAGLIGAYLQPPEYVEAMKWLLIAEKGGSTVVAAGIKSISGQMSASELSQARAKAADFGKDK